jgi:serine/threonine protein kinase/tetratricopeptide (TPR) repeat protein
VLDDSLTAGHLEPTSVPDSRSSSTAVDTHEPRGTRGDVSSRPGGRAVERDEHHVLGPGDRFAGFQIRKFLGRGAMGVVYEAWDPTLERRVALKLLRSPSRRAAERLLREARALARLDHPGVVRIWAADVHRGAVYIAMELVEGQNLREWLKTPRSWNEVLPVLIGAGRGLAAAHAAGVIHRDFKPENVLVGWDGQARVLDFGIARISTQHPDHLSSTIDGTQTSDGEGEGEGEGHCGSGPLSGSFAALPIEEELTEAGALIGTLLYMAPEQHARERADERSDQFGFCTTLFEAIFGAHPFPAKSRGELALLVAEGNVRFPNDDHSKSPRWLERVILKGLSPDRELRFATMDDLIDALERHPRRRRARNRALTAAAVLTGAVTLGLMVPRAEPANPCVDVASELEEVLGESQRQEIAKRFAAVKNPWAGEMGKLVNEELEAWAARWIEARTEVCETRHTHREATVIDERREACLAQQLAEAAALGAVLTEAVPTEAQERVLANAERALTMLEDPQLCVGDDPPIGRVVVTGEHHELVEELFEIEVLAIAGGDSRTLERARALVEEIRALPSNYANDSLLGYSLVALAEAELLEGNSKTTEALLHEAIRVAERIAAEALRAQALVDLGWLLATTPGRAHEAVPLLEDVAPLVERLGNRYDSIRQRQALAEAMWANGDTAGARQIYEALLGDASASRNIHFTTLLGLGRVAAAEEDYAAALEHSQAALARLELYGNDSALRATPLTNIGDALINLGRFDEARTALERGLELRRALLEAEASAGNRRLLGESLMNLANLESRTGNTEAASNAYREALALLPEDDHANRSLVLFNLGVDHQVAGRHVQALGNYEEALRLAERVLPLDSKQVVGARLGVGSMLVTLDRAAEARAPLERCLADWPPIMQGTFDEAELQFALARTWVALDGWSVESETLASKAAARYRQLGDPVSAEAIDAWVRANAP